jgi:hypothetical protein
MRRLRSLVDAGRGLIEAVTRPGQFAGEYGDAEAMAGDIQRSAGLLMGLMCRPVGVYERCGGVQRGGV